MHTISHERVLGADLTSIATSIVVCAAVLTHSTMLVGAAFAMDDPSSVNPSRPPKKALGLAAQVEVDRQSSDPLVRKAAKKQVVANLLTVDLSSGDPARTQEAVTLLKKAVDSMPGWYSRMYLVSAWLTPLLKLDEIDLIEHIIDKGMSDAGRDVLGLSQIQYAKVRVCLARRKRDEAIAAAKTYYDVCPFEESEKAVTLFAEVLASTRVKGDTELERRFTQQQAEGIQMTAATGNNVGNLGPNVLKSISISGDAYREKIAKLDSGLLDYGNLTAKGNLLLLAGRPNEAKRAFEMALDLAGAKDYKAAVSNIARAIRAESGLIGPANAYILSLRGGK